MSRLWVVLRPSLVTGFHLAGVEAYGAEDIETIEELITAWLDDGETGLLAIEDNLMANMDRTIIRRLDASSNQFYVTISGDESEGQIATRSARIAGMIRRAVGVHLTFEREKNEVTGGK